MCQFERRGTPGESDSIIDRHDFLADRLADVFAERAIKPIVFELLENMRAPAGAPCHREYGREQIGRNS